MNKIAEIVDQLPPEMQQEVYDFARFLLQKKGEGSKPKRYLKPNWRGVLRDMRGQYTSVELQHKIREWWGD